MTEKYRQGRLPAAPGAPGRLAGVAEAVVRLGSQWMKPLREALPAAISNEQIRLVVAFARRSDEAPAGVSLVRMGGTHQVHRDVRIHEDHVEGPAE